METKKNDSGRYKFFIAIGRGLSFIALSALIGAWVSEFTNHEALGPSTRHLFNDAIAPSLLSLSAYSMVFFIQIICSQIGLTHTMTGWNSK